MLRRGCRLQVVATRILPLLFRTISGSRGEEVLRPLALSSSDTSSAGESSSSDTDEGEEAHAHAHQSQVLRAYLRNRRARCLARVREQGLVPAVLVDGDKERRPNDGSTDVFLSLDAKPLVGLLKHIGKRDFVSRVFDMNIYRSLTSMDIHESLQVLPRNLNYGPGKTNIQNVQFIRASPGQRLKLGVPLEYLGIDQCPGLKKGGTLKKLEKYIVYNCKATEVPAKIVVDMTVLEIGDRVQVQDLEVDFDLLESDKTMPVCEIVKDVSSLKAKAKKLKNELYFKKKALAEKESHSAQSHSLSDDEVDVSFEDDEYTPTKFRRQRSAVKESSGVNSNIKIFGSSRKGKVSERRCPLSDDETDFSDDSDEEVSTRFRSQRHVRSELPTKNSVCRVAGSVKKRTLSERKLHALTDDEVDLSDEEIEERKKGALNSARRVSGSVTKGKILGQRRQHLSSDDEGHADDNRDGEKRRGSQRDLPNKSRVPEYSRQGKASRRRLQGTPFRVNKATE